MIMNTHQAFKQKIWLILACLFPEKNARKTTKSKQVFHRNKNQLNSAQRNAII